MARNDNVKKSKKERLKELFRDDSEQQHSNPFSVERPRPQSSRQNEDPSQPIYMVFDVEYFDEHLQRRIRHDFIRKVYFLLMLQLMATTAIIVWFMFHEPTCEYATTNWWCFILATILIFAISIAFMCFDKLRRESPLNYILLAVFTVALSSILGLAACRLETEIVLMSAGITILVCLALTIFAFQTRWDFTVLRGALLVALIILIVMGVVTIFLYDRILNIVFSSIAVFVFSMLFIYDTQLMLGGRHKYVLSTDEYVAAALQLYIDIILIFLHIMNLMR